MAVLHVLASFSNVGKGKDGGALRGGLFMDSQGNLFGTTWFGGTSGAGTAYEIPRTGTDASGLSTYGAKIIITSFGQQGAALPFGGLIADSEGNLYGTSLGGGPTDNGTVFKLVHTGTNPDGAPTYASVPTTVVNFNGANGDGPFRELITDNQGNLYGTTGGGGANSAGTVFQIARTGTDTSGAPIYASAPTTIVSFKDGKGSGSTGFGPVSGLFADPQGNLYGTTTAGGAHGFGTVFEIARTGTSASGAPTYAASPTVLVSFASGEEGEPNNTLTADSQGNLYGTTARGGANNAGTIYEIARTGTSASGAPTYASSPTILVTFGGAGVNTNGGTPCNSLIFDANGNLFGTTQEGGTYGEGTVFKLARTGVSASGAPTYASNPTILVSFDGSNGSHPFCNLIADAKGNLYGTTSDGGAFGGSTSGVGTVFRITDSGFVPGTPTTAAPTNLLLSNSLVAEFAKAGTVVGTLSAVDADAGDRFIYKLIDNGGGRFALSGDTLKIANGLLLDYEHAKSATLKVQITDSQGHSLTKTLTVAIKDVSPEFVTGSALADKFVGGSSNDKLYGMAGNDTLFGGGGDDLLDGGSGADMMTGGAGTDTYFVDQSGDLVFEAKGAGSDTVRSSVSYSLAAGQEIEALTTTNAAGTGAINLTGNEFAQVLVGNNGVNILDGRGGADKLTGYGGSDTYVVDNARDLVIEAANGGTDTVRSSVSFTLAANVENLTLTGTSAINGTGNALANTITGNGAANVLNGAAGADTMVGGAGNDIYVVDNAGDRVFEARGGGADRVVTSVSYTLTAGQEIEALSTSAGTGTAALQLTGNQSANTITGNAGANVLNGGLGHDVLTGGKGADTFMFATTLGTDNVDHIVDFAPVDDTIRLSKSLFAALAPGDLKASEFKDIAKAKIDADDHILYDSRSGSLFYDADGSGKGGAVKFAVLDNHAKLAHDDFFVV